MSKTTFTFDDLRAKRKRKRERIRIAKPPTRKRRYPFYMLLVMWWLWVLPMAYMLSASFLFDAHKQPENNIHRVLLEAYSDYNVYLLTIIMLGFMGGSMLAIPPQNRVRGTTPRWCVECHYPVDESNPAPICPECGADLTREHAIDGGVPIPRWPLAGAMFALSAILAGVWVWKTFFW